MKNAYELSTDTPVYRFLLAGHIEAPGIKRSIRRVNRRQQWRRLKARLHAAFAR